MLAAGEALPAEKAETGCVFSDWGGKSIGQLVLLCSWSLSVGKEETVESPASFIATIFLEKRMTLITDV